MALERTFAVGEVLNAVDVNNYLLSMWVPIDKRVIASGSPVTSVSFQSIASSFRFFRLTMFYQSSSSNYPIFRFNNDSGNNYSVQFLLGNDTTVVAQRFLNQSSLLVSSGASSVVSDIYTLTIGKPLAAVAAAASIQVTHLVPSAPFVEMVGGYWNNTSQLIDRIDILAAGGSSFYGTFALEAMRAT